MKKNIVRLLLVTVCLLALFIGTAQAATCKVTGTLGDFLPMLDKVGYDTGATIWSLSIGDTVSVLNDEGNGWLKVATGDRTGYIESRYTDYSAPAAPTPTPTPPSGPTGTAYLKGYSGEMITLYSDASLLSSFKGQYVVGTQLVILSSDGVWCRAEIQGVTGYFQMINITFQPPGQPTASPTPTPTVPAGGLSGTAYVKTYYTGDRVPLYNNANTTSTVLDTYPNATQLYIISGDGNWCYVEVSGRRGYMQTQYITFQKPGQPTAQPGYTTAVVNNPDPRDKLNLRAQPDKRSTSLGGYLNGTTVRVLEYGGTWCRVEVGGIYGYMMTQYLYFGGSVQPTLAPDPGVTTYAYVNNPIATERLMLRQYPDTKSVILGRYYNGTRVAILEYGATWCRVQVDGIYGYMMTKYLSFTGSYMPTPTTQPSVPSGSTYATVTGQKAGEWLNLRALPSKDSGVLGKYYNNQSVLVLSYGAEWCRVQVDGKTGYMMTRYLSFSSMGTTTQGTLAVISNPIATQKLNLRAQADMYSDSLRQFYNGVVVTILKYGADWCYVEVDGLKGYMMTQYLRIL